MREGVALHVCAWTLSDVRTSLCIRCLALNVRQFHPDITSHLCKRAAVPPDEVTDCLDIAVSGTVPDTFDFESTQRSTELNSLGTVTNFTALKLATSNFPACDAAQVFDASADGTDAFMGPLGAHCGKYLEELDALEDATQTEGVSCSEACVRYQAMLGVCSVTDLAKVRTPRYLTQLIVIGARM